MSYCHTNLALFREDHQLIIVISSGFDLQFLERRDEMEGMYNATRLSKTCDAWNAYVEASGVEQEDSGV